MKKRVHSSATDAPTESDARGIGDEDRALIDSFLERVWSELGLADNTLASYRLDLEGFARTRHGDTLQPLPFGGIHHDRRCLILSQTGFCAC